MKCPRCHAGIAAAPDQGGSIVCPGCGARLRSRPSVPASIPAAAASSGKAEPRPRTPPPENPFATLPPGSRLLPIPAPSPPAPTASVERESATLEVVLAELRAMRSVQEEMLELLRSGPTASPELDSQAESFFPDAPPRKPVPPVRAGRRKTVLLMDDDAETRAAALAALEAAEVPVRQVDDGNAALAAIAKEKPDVIVMELAMGGAMGGKDVVNMIKATMEWLDIPIVLYTRMPIENQREVRQIHGADDYVPKGPSSPEALVARVIALFRRS